MGIKVIGDAAGDRESWLEARKGYLTASSIFTWREVDHPRWWGDKRDGIIAEKFEGVEKTFDESATVSMAHGSFSEQDIARKFEDGIGYRVETSNEMFVNSKYPGLAATVDGYLFPEDDLGEPETNYCQDARVFPRLRRRLGGRPKGVLELKRSVSLGWQTDVPIYYVSQVQCQLHLAGLDWAVICADTICRQGRRTYWDLRPYLIEKDPTWHEILSQCSDEFLAVKKEYS